MTTPNQSHTTTLVVFNRRETIFRSNRAMTMRVAIPNDQELAIAADLLRNGELCAFPTETVYGLGANALSSEAVQRIYQAKGRPASNPLIVHVTGIAEAAELTSKWTPLAQTLAERFWPGPLTLVLPRSPRIPSIVSADLNTVALRSPAHPVAQSLLQVCKRPLAAPSANRSEQLSPTTAEHVARSGLSGLSLILDGGPCSCGIESTVVDLTQDPPRLLRPGALPLSQLRTIIPQIAVPKPGQATNGPHHSPGMSERHYAPKAKVILIQEGSRFESSQDRSGLLTRESIAFDPSSWLAIEQLPNDPNGFAADLYAALHRLDDQGLSSIVVTLPPNHEDWLGVRDRLIRASAQA